MNINNNLKCSGKLYYVDVDAKNVAHEGPKTPHKDQQ